MILSQLHPPFAAALLPGIEGGIAPLGYLRGFGAKAYPVTALTWGLLIISIIVVIIITALVIIGITHRASRGEDLLRIPVGGGMPSAIVHGPSVNSVAVESDAIFFTTIGPGDTSALHGMQKP